MKDNVSTILGSLLSFSSDSAGVDTGTVTTTFFFSGTSVSSMGSSTFSSFSFSRMTSKTSPTPWTFIMWRFR